MKFLLKTCACSVVFVSILCGDAINQLAHAFAECASAPVVPKNIPTTDAVKIYSGIFDTLKKEYQAGTYQENYNTFSGFTKDVLLNTADAFVLKAQEQLKKAAWLQGGTPDYLFVRKLVLPAGSKIALRGDLHGDALSLILWLERLKSQGWFDKNNPFKIVKQGHYLAFLGDYTDRGHYGAEVMFIIMQLFLHNPDQVILVRGNHEDLYIIDQYGFLQNMKGLAGRNPGELMMKFGKEGWEYNSLLGDLTIGEGVKQIENVYKCMPVALFLGCDNGTGGVDFIQCCHGGMEPGYNSVDLLDDSRTDLYQWINESIDVRKETACAIEKDMNIGQVCACSEAVCNVNGFQWNDFDFMNSLPSNAITKNLRGGYDFYKDITTSLLKAATKKGSKHNVWSVLRAHQHSGSTVPHILTYGKGIYKLWSETTKKAEQWSGEQNPQWSGKEGEPVALQKYSVWTFNVAPRAGYEVYAPDDFYYDTGAELTLEKGFDNWEFVPHQVPVMTAK